jgi:hypothetical protein
MKNTLLTTLISILMLASGSIVAAQGFEENTIRLTVDSPNIGNTAGGPFDSVVGSHIEFGPSGSVVPVDIDFTSNTINLDYSSGGSFASGTFNGYVFTDLNDTIPDIQDVSIDPTTTLGIDGNRVSFNQNQIFINVASLSYNSSSKIKLYVNFSSVLLETSYTGSGYDEAFNAGKQTCINNPASCGITVSYSSTPVSDDCMADYSLAGQLHVPCVSVPDVFGGTTVYDIELNQQRDSFTFDLDMGSIKPR